MVQPLKKELTSNPALLQYSCLHKGIVLSIDEVENKAMVDLGASVVETDIHFNCQHWLYNATGAPSIPADATAPGHTAICLGEYVAVFVYMDLDQYGDKLIKKYITLGEFDDENYDSVPVSCYPIFDMGDSFLVMPFNTSNAPTGSSFPFIDTTPNNDPLALINPFTDIEGVTRCTGTPCADEGYNFAIGRRVGNDYVFHRPYEFMREDKKFKVVTEDFRFAGRLGGHIVAYNSALKYFLLSGIPWLRVTSTYNIDIFFSVFSAYPLNGLGMVAQQSITLYGSGTWDSGEAMYETTAASMSINEQEQPTCSKKIIEYLQSNSMPPYFPGNWSVGSYTRIKIPSVHFIAERRGFSGEFRTTGDRVEFDTNYIMYDQGSQGGDTGYTSHNVLQGGQLTNTTSSHKAGWELLTYTRGGTGIAAPVIPPGASTKSYDIFYEFDPNHKLTVTSHPSGNKIEAVMSGTYSYSFSETYNSYVVDTYTYYTVSFDHTSVVDQKVEYYIGDMLLGTTVCKGNSSMDGVMNTEFGVKTNTRGSRVYNMDMVTNVHAVLVDLSIPMAVIIEADIFTGDDETPCDVQYRMYLCYNGIRVLLQTHDTAWPTDDMDGWDVTAHAKCLSTLNYGPRYNDPACTPDLFDYKIVLPHIGYIGYECDLSGDFSTDFYDVTYDNPSYITWQYERMKAYHHCSGMDVFGCESTALWIGDIGLPYTTYSGGMRRSGNLTKEYQYYPTNDLQISDSEGYFASLFHVIPSETVTAATWGFNLGKSFYINFVSPLDGSTISWSEDLEDLAKMRDAAGYATPNNTDFTF